MVRDLGHEELRVGVKVEDDTVLAVRLAVNRELTGDFAEALMRDGMTAVAMDHPSSPSA